MRKIISRINANFLYFFPNLSQKMNERQEKLFKNIVAEYIKTAQPVGSKLVVDKYLKNFSSATVRNDMSELENLGLIAQPHTSAGRIPTEAGYKKYVVKYVDLTGELGEQKKNEIIKTLEHKNIENKIKTLAKVISEKSNLLVFVGFSKNNFYYTGLANLFSQPEFQNLNLVYNLSDVIDHLDEVVARVYNEVDDKVQIKIGKENLFSDDCSCVMIKVKNVLVGIAGPMRMEYQKCACFLNVILRSL